MGIFHFKDGCAKLTSATFGWVRLMVEKLLILTFCL